MEINTLQKWILWGGILITLPSKENKDQFQWYGVKYYGELAILYISRYFI